MRKNTFSFQKGSLLIECILVLTLFSIGFYALISLYRSIEEVSLLNTMQSEALRIAEQQLDNAYVLIKNDFDREYVPVFGTSTVYKIQNTIKYENEALKIITSKVIFNVFGHMHEVVLDLRVTDQTRAQGISTCNEYIPETNFTIKSRFDFNSPGFLLEEKNGPTDIDVVGKYAYVTFDSAVATDTDFAIFDVGDGEHPLFLSKIDTGPGLSSVHVVSKVAYVANRSSNAQLQVLGLGTIDNPTIIQHIKLPGTYPSGTTLGRKVWYSQNRVFLGTDKSDSAEIYIFDASDLNNLLFKSSFEIGAGVNDFVSDTHNLFVANPIDPELLNIDISSISNPFLKNIFDAPTGSGNGKSLALLGPILVLGRTIGDRELYLLNASSSSFNVIDSLDRSASIDGLIMRTDSLFSLSPQMDDMFQMFSLSSTTIKKIDSPNIIFPSRPISFDCDKSRFFVIAGKSLYILSP